MFQVIMVIIAIGAIIAGNNKLTELAKNNIYKIYEEAKRLAKKAKTQFDDAQVKARMAGADSVIKKMNGILNNINEHNAVINEFYQNAQAEMFFINVYNAARNADSFLSEIYRELARLEAAADSLEKDYSKIWLAKTKEIVAEAASLAQAADTAAIRANAVFTDSEILESTYCEEAENILAKIAKYVARVKQQFEELENRIKAVKSRSSAPVSDFRKYTDDMKSSLQKAEGLLEKLLETEKVAYKERLESDKIKEQARPFTEIIKTQTDRAIAVMNTTPDAAQTGATLFLTRYDTKIYTLQRKALLSALDAAKLIDRINAPPKLTSNIAKKSIAEQLKKMTEPARETADAIENLIQKAEDERIEKTKEEQTLIAAAKTGNAEKKYELCEWYLKEKITGKFALWLEKAAESGHIPAQRLTAQFYLEGIPNFDCDTAKAMQWYEKAAEQGDTESQFKLGALLYPDTLKPAVTPKDIENAKKAAFWLEKAANSSCSEAQGRLAAIYSVLTAEPDCEDKKSQWLEKAVSTCDAESIAETAMQLMPVDAVKSFTLLSEAYEKTHGSLTAIYLGILRCIAAGFINNPEKGAQLIEEGIRTYPGALPKDLYRKLGNLYLNGRASASGEPDYYKAAQLLEKSGENRYILQAIREKAQCAEYVKIPPMLRIDTEKTESSKTTAAETEAKYTDAEQTYDVKKAKELFDKAVAAAKSATPVQTPNDIYTLNEALGCARQALELIPSDFPDFSNHVRELVQSITNLINIGRNKLNMQEQRESVKEQINSLENELGSILKAPENNAPRYESAAENAKTAGNKAENIAKDTKKPSNIRGVHGDLAARIDGNTIRGIYGDLTARIDGNNIRGIHGDLIARVDGNVIRDIHGNITHRLDGNVVRDIHGNVMLRLD